MMSEELKAILKTQVMEATREQAEEIIKAWRDKRAVRLEANRIMEDLKKEEIAMASWLLEVFKQQKFEGMLVGGRITGLTEKEVAAVSDKEALINYIRNSGELDLLQFRLSTGAVDERKENGVQVPGTEYITVHELFDRKS
jgi:hypothetical protein